MKLKQLITLSILCACVLSFGFLKGKEKDPVLAKVGRSKITVTQLEGRLQQLPEQNRAFFDKKVLV